MWQECIAYHWNWASTYASAWRDSCFCSCLPGPFSESTGLGRASCWSNSGDHPEGPMTGSTRDTLHWPSGDPLGDGYWWILIDTRSEFWRQSCAKLRWSLNTMISWDSHDTLVAPAIVQLVFELSSQSSPRKAASYGENIWTYEEPAGVRVINCWRSVILCVFAWPCSLKQGLRPRRLSLASSDVSHGSITRM